MMKICCQAIELIRARIGFSVVEVNAAVGRVLGAGEECGVFCAKEFVKTYLRVLEFPFKFVLTISAFVQSHKCICAK